ncbi:hypothetical protein FIBSPDRAFT_967209 [Athelia psychrophila]|uniref:Uncharacterized protein n=1 Tax=Athelia psychrophila TaxID=1759441 RepID=A0A167VYK1_9AGAM|nr:hypothetical protein FIBSPDRAFT_967209 [Fibularhizoctonia sp. CBS 109695]
MRKCSGSFGPLGGGTWRVLSSRGRVCVSWWFSAARVERPVLEEVAVEAHEEELAGRALRAAPRAVAALRQRVEAEERAPRGRQARRQAARARARSAAPAPALAPAPHRAPLLQERLLLEDARPAQRVDARDVQEQLDGCVPALVPLLIPACVEPLPVHFQLQLALVARALLVLLVPLAAQEFQPVDVETVKQLTYKTSCIVRVRVSVSRETKSAKLSPPRGASPATTGAAGPASRAFSTARPAPTCPRAARSCRPVGRDVGGYSCGLEFAFFTLRFPSVRGRSASANIYRSSYPLSHSNMSPANEQHVADGSVSHNSEQHTCLPVPVPAWNSGARRRHASSCDGRYCKVAVRCRRSIGAV